MPSSAARLAHPKAGLSQVTLHKSLTVQRTLYAALFVLGHAMAVSYCVQTAGEPYRAAVAQAAKMDNATNATGMEGVGEIVGVEKITTKSPAAAPVASAEEWPVEDDDETATATVDPTSGNGSVANATVAKKERPLPHEWLPSALACALLFASATLNCLFYLLTHWSVGFKASWFFSGQTEPKAGSYLYFVPLAHKGRPAIVRLTQAKGSTQLTCEYQRQRYEIVPSSELAVSAAAAKDGTEHVGLDKCSWAVKLTACPVDLPHTAYSKSAGHKEAAAVAAAKDKYGTNVLSVATPRFLDLYVEQLLSPLVIFQLFTSALWLLDSVSIGFTIFQVFTVLLLESTSVFQRRKTLQTLNQMSAKPYMLPV